MAHSATPCRLFEHPAHGAAASVGAAQPPKVCKMAGAAAFAGALVTGNKDRFHPSVSYFLDSDIPLSNCHIDWHMPC